MEETSSLGNHWYTLLEATLLFTYTVAPGSEEYSIVPPSPIVPRSMAIRKEGAMETGGISMWHFYHDRSFVIPLLSHLMHIRLLLFILQAKWIENDSSK